MLRYLLLLATILLFSCAPYPLYTWQDTREQQREDASLDLLHCRTYAADQYTPGLPAGEPYLKDYPQNNSDMAVEIGGAYPSAPSAGLNKNAISTHEIPIEPTGYPGQLDYAPDYLDDILEKCMLDRGWKYAPVDKEGQE